ncbi:MAG TPA: hypothetical protein DCM68_00505 [Verrucomicrobia bacterium]|nr:hypothetical protein [Verrucomicrobiota bacterium]
MTIPQLVSAGAGALVLAASSYSFFQHKTRRFKALFWAAIGAAMVYAGFRPTFIEVLGPDSLELRIRLIVALLSFSVLTVTLEAIRISRMQERYGFLWLATGLFLLAGALFPDLAHAVEAVTGISYGVAVLVVIFAFILLMLFHFSVALSLTQHKLAQIARELALAEERLRNVEERGAEGKRAT